LTISPTEVPCLTKAPVGQTCTHLPQLVQVSLSPQGLARSVMTWQPLPRPMMSQVWAPSISSQTRTQRVQSTQRLWSTRNISWLLSTS
jgi:hypothetical protein